MAHDYRVEPAAAARTACNCAELMATVAYFIPGFVEQLRWRGTGADARRIRFGRADNLVDQRGTDTAANAYAARNRV